MKTKVPVSHLLLLSLVILTISACKRRVATKMTKNMAAYIYAYTSGTVSKEAPVRVRFTSPLVKPEDVGKSLESGIFSLTPSVIGTAIWEDPQTLRFTPQTAFASGQTYIGAVKLKRLFKNVPKDAEEFEFDFRSRELYVEVVTDGIEPQESGKYDLLGELSASDRVADKDLEAVLTATQNGKALTINWVHLADGLRHTFRVKGVQRGEAPSTVALKWNGRPLGSEQTGETAVEIPKSGDFVAMNARLIQDAEQYIKINFSDPLSSGQDLNGLVKINDWYGTVRYAVDGSSILVYPNDRVTGDHNVYVDAAVQSSTGKRLPTPANFTLGFADVKPQVRLVGRGVILPNSNGLNFPFEAINLNFIDVEVVKIFNNNILQFLQTNDLDGNQELARVGKIIMQKRVALKDLNPSASATRWARYGLEVSELVKQDPSAIYQIRLGFRRAYSNYNCGNTAKDDLNGMTLLQQSTFFDSDDRAEYADDRDEWEGTNSIFRDTWNGGEQVGEWFNYQEQQNPCSPAYYNHDNFVQRNVFASDLGIVAKKGGDNSVFVVVSDLKSTYPRGGIKIDIFDYQQQLCGTATTNSDGVAVVKDIKGKPWMVVASGSSEKGYLPLSNNNALNLSRFDVAGTALQKGLKGYLYGERGVWRPGDSLHLNFILGDKDNKLPDDYPITLELYDPKGTLQTRVTSIENVKNIYPFNIATRPDAPTGNWRADIKAGGATFSERIKIETVKPNRLKINLDLGKKEMSAEDNTLNGNLQVNWLHGAPARNAKVRIEATMVSVPTTFPKYKTFVFDNPYKIFKSDPSVIFDNAVNDEGKGYVNAALPRVEGASGKLKMGLKIRAFEPSGDFSSDYTSVDYSPFKSYVGIEIPTDKYGEKRLIMNKESKVNIVMVDKNGTPLRNRSVDVNVYRVDWRWWWETGEDDAAQFASARDMKALITKKVVTNADGMAEVPLLVTQWGRYFVYAGDPLSNHYAGDFAYAGYPWDDNNNAGMSRNNAAMLSFNTNKDKYAVGETVELNIPTPDGGKALVSIENGLKVLETKWVNTKSGLTKYTFKTTPEMAPTVYAFVTLIQPHNTDKNDLPIRMYGVTPVNVEDPKTRLEPVVNTPDVLKPEEKVTVEVREKSGKPMAYTIALVDDGLLDLTRFETPNPWNAFYAREALGVQTFDVYDQVLGAYGGSLERILNIGGDGAGKPKNAQRANRFKPVVMTMGPFYLSGGQARHQITIPNYVGSVRAMVVAANENGAYGAGEKTVPVRKPLMVVATLPRVLSPKETLTLPVDVFAMDNKVKNATVTVSEKSGLVQIVSNKTKSVSFDKPGDKMVDFNLAVTEGVGIAKFQVIAEGGGERSTSEIEIDVRNPNPFVTSSKESVVQAGQTANIPYAALGQAGTNKATLEVSTLPPMDLASRLAYLLQYPYGCVEQITSTSFPQLYVDRLMNVNDDTKKKIFTNVSAAIDKLKQFQTAGGGFAYWQGETTADAWASNYVGHFLLEAKALGYALPPNTIERWLKAQQQAARQWSAMAMTEGWSPENHDLTQAYRLYTLAVAKSPENAAMNALREKPNLSVSARWRLAAAYAVAGKKEVAQQLTQNITATPARYRELSYTFGSDLRDQAMILETLVLSQNANQAVQVAREVAQKLSSGDWYGTQSVAYGLLSMAKFAQGNKIGSEFSFNYAINGKSGTFKSSTPIAQIELPSDGNNQINVSNTGKTPIFARLILRGQPSVGQSNEQAIASNLNMNIQYKTLKGEALDVRNIRQGTDFIAEVTVTNTGKLGKNYKEMALSQIFPSGWEILNSRMEKVPGYTNTSVPRYQDIRDDRVNTFFDLPIGKSHTYRVQLNAAYVGRYYLPNQLCEAMYDNSIMARQPGTWVDVNRANQPVN